MTGTPQYADRTTGPRLITATIALGVAAASLVLLVFLLTPRQSDPNADFKQTGSQSNDPLVHHRAVSPLVRERNA
jgi:hypothetical protein